jgi:putative flippase GtrA
MPQVRPLVTTLWQSPQIRYLAVAGTTTLAYLGLLSGGLAIGLHYMVAIVLALVAHVAIAFPAHRRFVFGPGGGLRRDFVRFLSVWSTGAVAGLVGTPLLVELVGLQPLIAQVIVIVVVAVGSYLGHRYFSFHPGTDVSDEGDGA